MRDYLAHRHGGFSDHHRRRYCGLTQTATGWPIWLPQPRALSFPDPDPLATAAYAQLQAVDVPALTVDQQIAYATALALLAVRGELGSIGRDIDLIDRKLADSEDVNGIISALVDLNTDLKRALDGIESSVAGVNSSIDDLAPSQRLPPPGSGGFRRR